MQEIIKAVAARAGLDEETARQVAGTLLSFVRDSADEADVRALFEQVPAAAELAEQGAAQTGGDAGGGLMGMLGGMLGGSLGAAMGALSRLQELGLDTGQIGEAGKALFEQLSEQADAETVQRILATLAGKVPGLDRFL